MSCHWCCRQTQEPTVDTFAHPRNRLPFGWWHPPPAHAARAPAAAGYGTPCVESKSLLLLHPLLLSVFVEVVSATLLCALQRVPLVWRGTQSLCCRQRVGGGGPEREECLVDIAGSRGSHQKHFGARRASECASCCWREQLCVQQVLVARALMYCFEAVPCQDPSREQREQRMQ